MLRAVIALTCLAIVGVLAANGLGPVQLVLFAAVAVIAVLMPASPAPALLIGFAAFVMAFVDGSPLRPGVLALIFLLHLFHVTCATAAVVPLKAKVSSAALRAPTRRFAAVQASVIALAGLCALLPNGPTPAPVELVGLAAATVVALAVSLRI